MTCDSPIWRIRKIEDAGTRQPTENRPKSTGSREGHATVRHGSPVMMKRETLEIADIYVPVKRRATLVPGTVDEIAASILEVGQRSPILVRRDGARLVLVEGLHRLEACKALGETTIAGYLVQSRKF
jgi:sulfiredoxin